MLCKSIPKPQKPSKLTPKSSKSRHRFNTQRTPNKQKRLTPNLPFTLSIRSLATAAAATTIPGISNHPQVIQRRLAFQQLAQTNPEMITPISIGTNGVDYPPFVFVLGGPGSGKGTHCDYLMEAAEKQTFSGLQDKIYHINVGGVLRQAQATYRSQIQTNTVTTSMSKAGPVLEDMLATGQILPSWVTVTFLREELDRISSEIEQTKKHLNGKFSANIIIDGFPRSIENLEAFEELIAIPSRLLVIDVPTETMLDRVMDRSKTTFREDDNFHTIKKRIDVFNSDTAAVLSHYCIQDSVEKALEFNKTHGVMRLGVKIWGDRSVDETSKDFIQSYIKLVNTPIY